MTSLSLWLIGNVRLNKYAQYIHAYISFNTLHGLIVGQVPDAVTFGGIR